MALQRKAESVNSEMIAPAQTDFTNVKRIYCLLLFSLFFFVAGSSAPGSLPIGRLFVSISLTAASIRRLRSATISGWSA